MFIESAFEDPRYFFTVVVAVILSIVLHELSHGWAAIYFGDRTPIERGHMTPNPIVHMGWMSLAMLAVVGIAWGLMPVNPSRMRGRYAPAAVAAAGPAMNLLIALVSLTLLGFLLRADYSIATQPIFQWPGLPFTLYIFGLLNLALLAFNLIPVPPLDGSRILANFVPAYDEFLRTQGGQGLILVLFLGVFFMARYLFAFCNDLVMKYLALFV